MFDSPDLQEAQIAGWSKWKMMKALIRFNIALSVLLCILLFSSYSRNSESTRESLPAEESTRLPQLVRPVDLDKQFDFAGEPLPMENFDVRERLDRELLVNSYWESSTVLLIKNTKRYFPVIEAILAEEGVPDDFKYLAVAESALRNATSPAGAKGVWQFLEKTGAYYGLEINREVDERYHLEKATRAACTYLKEYKERFGSWTLAAAAYNMGGTSMSRALERQGADSYYDLNISDETMRYVFRIVALKEVLSNHDDYGFEISDADKYEPFGDTRELEITSSVPSLATLAAEHGISYRLLKIYNPWLRSHKLNNPYGKKYIIEIPVETE